MATKVADLLVVISGNSQALRRELDAVKRQINSAFGGRAMAASEKAASALKWVAAGMAAIGVAAIKMNADMAMTTKAFEVLTGSADKAKEHLEQLESFAASTPFELPGLLEASKKLQAYGFQTEAVIPIMQAVGDAAMAVGLGQEGINRITLALGQMNAKGKMSAEEMRQLAETGLPAWEMLAQGIGVSVPQAMDLAKKGAIDAKTGITALLTGLDTRFSGMMSKMAGEIPQSFSNMQDSVKSIMRTLGADLTETLDLKTKMKGAADWLSSFAMLAKTSGIREALEQMIPDSIRTTIVGISAAVVGIAVPAFAMLAINVIAATWPILAIGAAFGIAAAAIYANWDKIGPFWSALWNGIVSVTKWAWEKVSAIFNAIGDAYNWLVGKLTAAANKIKALAGIEVNVTADTGEKAAPAEIKEAKKGILSLKDALKTLKSNAVGAEAAAGGVGSAAKKAAKLSVPAIKTQQDSYDQLAEKAKGASDRIEDEWIRLTGTQLDALEKWYREETATLEESRSANENYERDVQRLKETYAEKRRKILSDEAREHERTMKRITDGYSRMYSQLETNRLSGSDKGLFGIADSARQDVKGVKDFFAEIAADFAQGTERQKQDIIDALDEVRVAYEVTAQGTLDFSDEIARYELERFRQLQDDKVKYFRQCEDIKADIEEAYTNNSLAQLQGVLNKENLMRLENLNAQKRMMDLYQETAIAAHITTAEQTANILDSSRDSFKSFFTDVLTGAKDFGDALKDLVSNIWSNIVDQLAEKWSAQITEKLFGMFGGEGGLFGGLFGDAGNIQQQMAQETALSSLKIANISAETAAFTAGEAAKSAATIAGNEAIAAAATASLAAQTAASATAAAAIASAWAPAAAAVSLASFGSNSGPAMAGMTAAHALSQTLAKGLAPGFASGGYITGPGSGTSDSIPARLSNGEYVMKAEAVRRLGVSFLDKLNRGAVAGFASGGYVIPEFQTEPGRIESAAFSIPAKLIKALTGTDSRQDKEQPSGVVNIYGDINNNADERRLLRKLDATTRAALMGGY